MVADNTITPFDAAIKQDRITVMQNRAILARIICKLHSNQRKHIEAEDMAMMDDEEVALMVVATELVANTIAREMHRAKQQDRDTRPPLNGPGKADM